MEEQKQDLRALVEQRGPVDYDLLEKQYAEFLAIGRLPKSERREAIKQMLMRNEAQRRARARARVDDQRTS